MHGGSFARLDLCWIVGGDSITLLSSCFLGQSSEQGALDVKELAQHLTHFDYLFPSCVCPLVSIITGLASRIYVEEISKQGYSRE